MRTEIGKIQKIAFGWGGYQDCMIGFSITLGGKSWGVSTFEGAWGTDRSESTKWSEDDRLKDLGRACIFIRDILKGANKQTLDKLENIPIEAVFDEKNTLKSWRILEEVL